MRTGLKFKAGESKVGYRNSHAPEFNNHSIPVLMYGSETMLCKEKVRSGIMAVQRDNLRGLLGFMRMDGVPNSRIRELCGVKKGLDERIDKGVLQWFDHVKRMKNDRIAKRTYVGGILVVAQWVGRGRDGLMP